MSPLTTDSQLQIGIEIEFVAPRNVEWEDEHLPDLDHWNHMSLSKDACFHRLAVALHDAGLPACYQMKTTPLRCVRNPLREAAPSRSLVLGSVYRLLGDPARFHNSRRRRGDNGRAGLYRYWLVKGEYNLTDNARYKTWIACELNTPILSEVDVAGATLPDLDTALTALHGTYDSAPHISPQRCGLHVHLSPVSGGTLFFAQRILTLALLLDQALLSPLCDPSRKDLGRPFLSTAELSTRRDLVVPCTPALSAAARAHLPRQFAAAEGRVLSCIWRAETFDDLQQILEHHSADLLTVAPVLCKHKLAAVDGGEDNTTTTTVEFRHAQASFSSRFVRAWAGVVLAIGRVGLLGVEEYKHTLGRLWDAGMGSRSRDPEQMCLATLEVLSEAAVEAGMLGRGLDLGYWRTRCAQMREGQNPDVDDEGKVVLDAEGR